MGNQQVTELELGWLAGIYDGDGYIGFSRQNTKKCPSIRPDVQLVNCDVEIIAKVIAILRKIGINPYIRERIHNKKDPNKKKWSRNFIVSFSRFAQIKRFIDTIGHALTGEKHYRAEIMIKLVNSRIPKTRGNNYTPEERALVDEYFEMIAKKKIRGNTHKLPRNLNDYTPNARLRLAKI